MFPFSMKDKEFLKMPQLRICRVFENISVMFHAVHVLGGVSCCGCALEFADDVENLINSTRAAACWDTRVRRGVPDHVDRPDDEGGGVPRGVSGAVRLLLGVLNHGCSGRRLDPEFRQFLGRTAVRGLRVCPFEFQWWPDGLRLCVRRASNDVDRDATTRVYHRRDRPVLLPECFRRELLYYLDMLATNAHEFGFDRKQLGVFYCDLTGAMNDTSTFLINSRDSFSVADPQGVLVDDGLVRSLQELMTSRSR